MATLL
jgi:hypothetical protein